MIICCQCETAVIHSWLCDKTSAFGPWCNKCFPETDCGKGLHGEGCPTEVFEVGERQKTIEYLREDIIEAVRALVEVQGDKTLVRDALDQVKAEIDAARSD